MKQWRLWAVVGMYGVLYGAMGGLLARQNPAGALLWAVAMIAMHVGIVALLWWYRRAVRHG